MAVLSQNRLSFFKKTGIIFIRKTSKGVFNYGVFKAGIGNLRQEYPDIGDYPIFCGLVCLGIYQDHHSARPERVPDAGGTPSPGLLYHYLSYSRPPVTERRT